MQGYKNHKFIWTFSHTGKKMADQAVIEAAHTNKNV